MTLFQADTEDTQVYFHWDFNPSAVLGQVLAYAPLTFLQQHWHSQSLLITWLVKSHALTQITSATTTVVEIFSGNKSATHIKMYPLINAWHVNGLQENHIHKISHTIILSWILSSYSAAHWAQFHMLHMITRVICVVYMWDLEVALLSSQYSQNSAYCHTRHRVAKKVMSNIQILTAEAI